MSGPKEKPSFRVRVSESGLAASGDLLGGGVESKSTSDLHARPRRISEFGGGQATIPGARRARFSEVGDGEMPSPPGGPRNLEPSTSTRSLGGRQRRRSRTLSECGSVCRLDMERSLPSIMAETKHHAAASEAVGKGPGSSFGPCWFRSPLPTCHFLMAFPLPHEHRQDCLPSVRTARKRG